MESVFQSQHNRTLLNRFLSISLSHNNTIPGSLQIPAQLPILRLTTLLLFRPPHRESAQFFPQASLPDQELSQFFHVLFCILFHFLPKSISLTHHTYQHFPPFPSLLVLIPSVPEPRCTFHQHFCSSNHASVSPGPYSCPALKSSHI